MNSRRFWIPTAALLAILSIPCLARAQETGVVGTIRDTTDAVLPGVTVTALHVATGNTFVAVTDTEGAYRIPALRPGVYRVTAELSGFTTVTQESIELLVGQRAQRDFRMTVSAIQESITVTSAAPLLEARQSRIAGNIDTRQMEALPLNGRNWMQLTTLAPGARVNNASDTPQGNQPAGYQLNVDGQQVTATLTVGGLGDPHFSRDAIAEFQLVSSRFDATQGRSMGLQINVVTKAGTNLYGGSLSGYFRNDRLNAKDPVLNRVVPFSNQQISGTFGGPIKRDKIHFFANYEYERQPDTIISNVPYPVFNIPDVKTTRRQNYFGGRVDAVLTSNTRLMVRGSGWTFNTPVTGSSTAHPASRLYEEQATGQAFASLIHTKGRMVHEIKGGYAGLVTERGPLVPALSVSLAGFSIGSGGGQRISNQHTLSVRDDVTLFRGRHELKMGGEFLRPSNRLYAGHINKYGTLDATLGPVPANIGELFPVWNDPSTWNLAALSSITRRYTVAVGEFEVHCVDSPSTCRRRKPEAGAWFQENWTVTSALTLNLGIRWDFALDGMANDLVYPLETVYPQLPPIKEEKAPQQWANFGPRLGFAYSLPDAKTVLRGGWGLYFAGVTDRPAHSTGIALSNAVFEVLNDGRPNFAADPFNLAGGGRIPTQADAQAQAQGQRRSTASPLYIGKNPYSYQTSAGIQRQLGQTMAVTADYVWIAGKNEPITRNANLSFNPETGVNFPFTDVSKRPYPNFGSVSIWDDPYYENYHALETSFTKRFSDRWQAAVTYALAGTWDYYPEPINPGCVGPINGLTMTCDTYFKVQPDLGGVYGLKGTGGTQIVSEPDQRHRMVLNGIYELPGGFQVSGLYLYSSGIRQQSTYGRDVRNTGGAELGGDRLRADGTVIPRNSVVNDPIHRVDLRLQWRLRVGRASVEPLVEVFNLFNSTNFTRTWVELNPRYGQATGQSAGNVYRQVQLGFRTTF
jgi:hypothetical protein